MDEIINIYEDIKKNIISRGYTYDSDNDVFVKANVQKQTMIINGQQFIQENKIETQIKYLGEGKINENEDDEETLFGFSFYAVTAGDEQSIGDVWVRNWEELTSMIQIR